MKGIKYVFILLTFILIDHLQAQSNKSIYPSNISRYPSLLDGEISEIQALDISISQNSKKADIHGGLAIVGLIASTIFLLNLNDSNSSSTRDGMGLLISAPFAVLNGVAGLRFLDKKKRDIQKRSRLLNRQSQGHLSEELEFYVGISGHGVGLSIYF